MRKYKAEALGTMVLVLFGCGAAVIAGTSLGVLGIAFAFGLAIMAMVYTIGPISGCHINPAVSLAMFINKRINLKEFVYYVISQLVGGIVGALLLFCILKLGNYSVANMGQNSFGDFKWYGAFIIEIILTFVFVLTVIGVTGKKGNANNAGIVIGLALVLVHILGIKLTGTSVNPARSLGPALFAGVDALKQLWVFIVAPLVGGALAAVCGKFVLKSEA
ncbi:MAG: MIP family channel protein [Oscillospiraceae bacterium]|nr:MIP family channel protein [Oscillospiraceae bacterium]